MKKNLIYGIVLVVIIFGVLTGVFIIHSKKDHIYYGKNIIFNQIENYQNVGYGSDVQIIENPCDCIRDDYAGFQLPVDVVLKSEYGLSLGGENIHDYVFGFKGNGHRQVTIAYSSISEPVSDRFIEGDHEVSDIDGVEFILYQYGNNVFITSFYYDQKYYDIKTVDLTKNEFIHLLKGIISE